VTDEIADQPFPIAVDTLHDAVLLAPVFHLSLVHGIAALPAGALPSLT
jgi:hypothetical protein